MNNAWLVFAFAGQFMFGARFLIQWIASERKKRSYIPLSFWYFSLAGGVILFTYALHRKDPVFILGQAFGVLVYTRNLVLIARHKSKALTD